MQGRRYIRFYMDYVGCKEVLRCNSGEVGKGFIWTMWDVKLGAPNPRAVTLNLFYMDYVGRKCFLQNYLTVSKQLEKFCV
ncbi:MAG: hypothetical protein PWR01_598 [Clostridiales bacterium]|nr:hypothetical protein [Clostridiales bacterium]